MNSYPQQAKAVLRLTRRIVHRFCHRTKRLLWEQFNKNLYTRILFTNVALFIFGMIAVTMLSGLVVKQATYDQVEQELLRKAKRVNFALLQQKDQSWSISAGGPAGNQSEGARQDLLRFLADSFDCRITVFDKAGRIISTSAEQEVVPGSTVDNKLISAVTKGEPAVASMVDKETGQLRFSAVIPMGNNKEAIENGILLETNPVNPDRAVSKMRLYLLIGGVFLLVVIIIVSVHLAMHVSRPISRLAGAMAEISRGSYVFCHDDQQLEELHALSDQLNKLAVWIQKMQAESSRMEEERARLFAEISHELRTPLTAVQGFVEAIRDGIVQDQAMLERYLDTIYTQTVHITRLVDDLLVLSRLESGNITVEKLPVDLHALVQGVTMSMEGLAKKSNIAVVLEKKTENAVVVGDVDRMEQIIRNLLKNAIRAAQNGTIRICLVSRQDEVTLTIEDNGVGIAPDDLPHIWDRFYKAKNQRFSDAQEKGTGLGLVIVKKLVQMQGGKIEVSSQLGKGTTFTISFPSFQPQ